MRILDYRANTIVLKLEDKDCEIAHINKTLETCGYPKWALLQARRPKTNRTTKQKPTKHRGSGEKNITASIPYIQGTSEKIKRVLGELGITTSCRAANTFRQRLVHPKDKLPKEKRCTIQYNNSFYFSNVMYCTGSNVNNRTAIKFISGKRLSHWPNGCRPTNIDVPAPGATIQL